MGEWTPGPWTVGYRAMDVTGFTEKGRMKVCDIRGWGHLTGKGHGALGLSEIEGLAVQEANANLIAAAPDLYGALDAIIQYMADHGSTIPSNYIERAYAALDKAAAQRDMQEVEG